MKPGRPFETGNTSRQLKLRLRQLIAVLPQGRERTFSAFHLADSFVQGVAR